MTSTLRSLLAVTAAGAVDQMQQATVEDLKKNGFKVSS
jgi:hypothetical protein